MASTKKTHAQPPLRTGPIKPGSCLYRLLEAIAARVAARIQREALRK